MNTHEDYECPKCGEWIEILPTTSDIFDCPWCKEPLQLFVDAEFRDGLWRDMTKLISKRSHIEQMIKHSQRQQ